MTWYEIYHTNGQWDVYKVTEGGACYQLYKVFKTKKAADNFARKQWVRVIRG